MKGKKLQADYNELLEKYDRVLSEKSAAQYELSELKAAAENISRQDEEVRKLYESIRSIKHDMRNHLMVIASLTPARSLLNSWPILSISSNIIAS